MKTIKQLYTAIALCGVLMATSVVVGNNTVNASKQEQLDAFIASLGENGLENLRENIRPGMLANLEKAQARFKEGGLEEVQPIQARKTHHSDVKRIEASFDLVVPAGVNPFDYKTFQVMVELSTPCGKVQVPAFYDGGLSNSQPPAAVAPFTWRMRFSPREKGDYKVKAVLLNGVDQHIEVTPHTWNIKHPVNNFIHVGKDAKTFQFDNGDLYLPIGHNINTTALVDFDGNLLNAPSVTNITNELVDMARHDENYARMSMNPAFISLNLFWGGSIDTCPQTYPGYLDLDVAHRWDTIIDSLEENGIYLDLLLNDAYFWSFLSSAFDYNPWNANNLTGCSNGFLTSPYEFFTNPTALEYTLRMVYYIVARWGYSPNVLSFETINEISASTYFLVTTNIGVLSQWNQNVIDLIHQYDFNKHLITDSPFFMTDPIHTMFQEMDYFAPHAYVTTGIEYPEYYKQKYPHATNTFPLENVNRPYHLNEFGQNTAFTKEEMIQNIHQVLWAMGLSHPVPPAAWYGAGDQRWIPEHNEIIGSFAKFATISGMKETKLENVEAKVTTPKLYDLQLSSRPYEFEILPYYSYNAYPYNFVVTKEGASQNYINGNPTVEGFTNVGDVFSSTVSNPIFTLSSKKPFQISVVVSYVNSPAATLQFILDGNLTEYPNLTVGTYTIDVPAGDHVFSIANGGTDFFIFRQMTLSDYGYGLTGISRATDELFVSWIYKRPGIVGVVEGGEIELPKLKPGAYKVVWYNTTLGEIQKKKEIKIGSEKERLKIPSVETDIALFIKRIDC